MSKNIFFFASPTHRICSLQFFTVLHFFLCLLLSFHCLLACLHASSGEGVNRDTWIYDDDVTPFVQSIGRKEMVWKISFSRKIKSSEWITKVKKNHILEHKVMGNITPFNRCWKARGENYMILEWNDWLKKVKWKLKENSYIYSLRRKTRSFQFFWFCWFVENCFAYKNRLERVFPCIYSFSLAWNSEKWSQAMKSRVKILMDKHSIIHGISIYISQSEPVTRRDKRNWKFC